MWVVGESSLGNKRFYGVKKKFEKCGFIQQKATKRNIMCLLCIRNHTRTFLSIDIALFRSYSKFKKLLLSNFTGRKLCFKCINSGETTLLIRNVRYLMNKPVSMMIYCFITLLCYTFQNII